MDRVPPAIIFLQYFPEEFIVLTLGLLFVGVKPPLARMAVVAFAAACLAYFARMLPLHFGFHALLILISDTVLVCLVFKVRWWAAILGNLIALSLLVLGEGISVSLMIPLMGWENEEMFSTLWPRLLLSLPHLTVLAIFIWCCWHFNWALIRPPLKEDWLERDWARRRLGEMKSQQAWFWLVCLVLAQGIIFSGTSIAWVGSFHTLINPFWMSFVYCFFAAVSSVLGIALARNLFRVASQEARIRAREEQVNNINELLRTLRAQHHDFVNHVQAIYGLLQIGNGEGALRYIKQVYGTVKQGHQILHLNRPELISLLQAKIGEAEAKGVQITVRTDSEFCGLSLTAEDLNRIIGNLVNNALEAAESSGALEKWVEIELLANEDCYLIKIDNCGEIDGSVRRRIFQPGFSTKGGKGHEGLGLYAVHEITERYGGSIRVDSQDGRTSFKLSFSARQRRDKKPAIQR